MGALLTIIALAAYYPSLCAASGGDTLLVEEYTLGAFQHAVRVDMSAQGWIYVIDADRNSVSLFRDKISSPITVGGYGWTSTAFDGPRGIATDGINVYIADHGNHRIQRFDRNLNFISTFFTRDTTILDARFGYPSGVAISRFGDFFILDEENIRIVKFSAQSQFERTFGSLGDERGKLQHPLKILLSPDDHVYVLEPNKIIVYDYFGNYVRTFGVGVLHNAKGFAVGSEKTVVVTSDTLYWFSKQGDLAGAMPAKNILSSAPLRNIEDVAVVRDRLYLLTAEKVFVFKVSD